MQAGIGVEGVFVGQNADLATIADSGRPNAGRADHHLPGGPPTVEIDREAAVRIVRQGLPGRKGSAPGLDGGACFPRARRAACALRVPYRPGAPGSERFGGDGDAPAPNDGLEQALRTAEQGGRGSDGAIPRM
jgi:hypothetical protein